MPFWALLALLVSAGAVMSSPLLATNIKGGESAQCEDCEEELLDQESQRREREDQDASESSSELMFQRGEYIGKCTRVRQHVFCGHRLANGLRAPLRT